MFQFRLAARDQTMSRDFRDEIAKEYELLYERFAETDLAAWNDALPPLVETAIFDSNNGHLPKWSAAMEALPEVTPTEIRFDKNAVTIGAEGDVDDETRALLRDTLKQFHPWRKGPWSYFGIEIDTEWKSNLKWDRLEREITPLKDRLVLDIGGGNGYYGYRMLQQDPKMVVIAEPSLLFLMQSLLPKRFLPRGTPIHNIPLGIQDLPPRIPAFDTVFSMGVLYHRKSPINHLLELREHLRPGGELILETLVIDGPEGHTLLPKDRYAQMRNVWFLPSCLTLEKWLERCGFKNIRLAGTSYTTTEEQRSTEWMTFHSLPQYLDPEDSTKTIEGYPGPQRALFIANV